MAETASRPDPDALLASVSQTEARSRRAKLKVYFGFAPGVGKTYAMLEGARRIAAEGTDVVVGAVETHGRAETEALLAGLELLPRRPVEYRGVVLQEFDLEGALARARPHQRPRRPPCEAVAGRARSARCGDRGPHHP